MRVIGIEMWRAINESLSNLCSSVFWDDLVWNSPDPDLTGCFEDTILAWFPCAFLWIFSPLEIYFLSRTKTFSIPFNRYNTFKLGIIAVLQTIALVDIIRYFLNDSKYLVEIYTPVVQFLSFSLFSCLTYANIKCGVTSSGILFIFSFLLVVCGAAEFLTILKSRLNSFTRDDVENNGRSQGIAESVHFGTYLVYYISVLIVFFLNCFCDINTRLHVNFRSNDIASSTKESTSRFSKLNGQNPCPEKTSSFLSKIFLAWSDKFVWKGYKKPLKYDDLWDLDDELRTEQLVERFESKWHLAVNRLQKTQNISDVKVYCETKESLKSEEDDGDLIHVTECKVPVNSKEISILRPLFEVFGWHFWCGVVVLKLVDSSLHFANSFMLNVILAFVENENEVSWHGYFYVIVLLMNFIVQSIFYNRYHHIMNRTGLQIRNALVMAIYKKALKISKKGRRDFSLGEIINLVAVDAQTFPLVVPYFPYLWTCSLEISLAVYCIWNILGACVLGGVVVMIMLTIVSFVLLYRIQKQRMKQMKHKDRRLKLTNEVLSGIKILKLYACEPSFEKEIVRIRGKELKVLKDTAYLHAGSTFAWVCAVFLLCFVTFGLYVLSSKENVLDARVVFVSLSLFTIMKWSLELMPWIITRVIQANVAIKRISKFLNSEELDPNAVSHEQRSEPIVVENGEFSWESDTGTPTLSNINVNINSGDLVAIVGSVGCGKSSFLSAILGEMYKLSGYVNTTGKLAYVPQEAWIQNATLRDNITFGDDTKYPLYKTILESCALVSDLEILSGGDQTEIGEKGINLSGGQKQRISLGRAVFSEADIYLLDDPLSAVDAHVGKHIFENVIGSNGLLNKKTRLFVTHNISYLPQVDQIIVLQNGTISETGTYKELLNKGGDFATFLATYVKTSDENYAETNLSLGTEKQIENFNDNDKTLKSSRNFLESEDDDDEEKNNEIVERAWLTESEKVSSDGNDKGNIYVHYFRAMGLPLVSATILSNVLYQIFSVKANYWLSEWANVSENYNKTDVDDHVTTQYNYLCVYALFGVGQAISVTSQTIVLFIGTVNAAKFVHNRLLNSILRWPIITFDRIPFGRILNRLGSDVDILDGLSIDLLDLVTYVGFVMSSIFVISYNLPPFMGALLPIGVVYYFIQKLYTGISKQLKRLESASKSPIYSHFGDTIAGAHSIRAYGLQTTFVKTCEKKVNFNQKCSYACAFTNRWFVSRLDLVGHFIIFSAALLAILARNTISAALVGLSINYAMQIIGDLYCMVVMMTGVKTSIVALERIREYGNKEQEAPWAVPEMDKAVAVDWPNQGEMVFKDFQMRYREDLEPVLKGINFTVRGGEKVGVVGRTGAGKSSLTLSLFRIIEAAGGSILIDGVDVSKIGLHILRDRLTIIPQDPVLFSGTLRMNLDPADKYSDESLWKTLESVNLKAYVVKSSFGLQYEVEDGGSNFSIGQRQLICLARALLRKTKILILDEATAAVDFETDDLIQATIRKEFNDCTVLTIAHRLNTVLDYDRILVLDRGCVAEFDSPASLLGSKQSVFYKMTVDAGLI